MLKLLVVVLAVLSVCLAEELTIDGRAASNRVNCGCQCNNLTFKDKYNRLQGNCKIADETGAIWCYVDQGSSCQDQSRSVRFGHKNWSYEACATPSLDRPSSICYRGNYQNQNQNYQNQPQTVCKHSNCGLSSQYNVNSGGNTGHIANNGNNGVYNNNDRNTGNNGNTGYNGNNGGSLSDILGGGSGFSSGGSNGGFSGQSGGNFNERDSSSTNNRAATTTKKDSGVNFGRK